MKGKIRTLLCMAGVLACANACGVVTPEQIACKVADGMISFMEGAMEVQAVYTEYLTGYTQEEILEMEQSEEYLARIAQIEEEREALRIKYTVKEELVDLESLERPEEVDHFYESSLFQYKQSGFRMRSGEYDLVFWKYDREIECREKAEGYKKGYQNNLEYYKTYSDITELEIGDYKGCYFCTHQFVDGRYELFIWMNDEENGIFYSIAGPDAAVCYNVAKEFIAGNAKAFVVENVDELAEISYDDYLYFREKHYLTNGTFHGYFDGSGSLTFTESIGSVDGFYDLIKADVFAGPIKPDLLEEGELDAGNHSGRYFMTFTEQNGRFNYFYVCKGENGLLYVSADNEFQETARKMLVEFLENN